jgi:hypothetical protein
MITTTIIDEFNLDISKQYLDGTKIEAMQININLSGNLLLFIKN